MSALQIPSRPAADRRRLGPARRRARAARAGPRERRGRSTSVARAARGRRRRRRRRGAARLPGWAATSPTERGALLGRWAELIWSDVEELARLEARDVGKPLSGGRMNIYIAQGIVDVLRRRRRQAHRRHAAHPLARLPRLHAARAVRGVRGGHRRGTCRPCSPRPTSRPALAAGNTVVLKPSEIAPLAPLALAELARRGRPAARRAQRRHRARRRGGRSRSRRTADIDHISFVGSTATGRAIMRGRGREPRAGQARARRQVAERACSPTPTSTRRSRDRRLDHRERRAELLRRLAAAGRGVDPRRGRRAGRRRHARRPTRAVGPGPRHGAAGQPGAVRARLAATSRARPPRAPGSSPAARPAEVRRAGSCRRRVFDQVTRACGSPARRSSARCSPSRASRAAAEAVELMNDTDFGLLAASGPTTCRGRCASRAGRPGRSP